VVRPEQVDEEEEAAVGERLEPLQRRVDDAVVLVLDPGVLVEAARQPEGRVHVDVVVDADRGESVAEEHLRQGGGRVAEAGGGELADPPPGTVHLRVEAGDDRGDRGQRPGRRRRQVGEAHRLGGQPIEVRGEAAGVAFAGEEVGA
jgi:hypothetical protein